MVEGVITIPLITVKPFVTGDRVQVVKGSGRGCFIDEIGHFYVKIGIISNHLAKVFKLITLLCLTLSPSPHLLLHSFLLSFRLPAVCTQIKNSVPGLDPVLKN